MQHFASAADGSMNAFALPTDLWSMDNAYRTVCTEEATESFFNNRTTALSRC